MPAAPDDDASASCSLPHGADAAPGVRIEGYSLQLHAGDAFLGDSVSRGAFSGMLDAWRTLIGNMAGKDPLGSKATEDLHKDRLDELLADEGPAGTAIRAAQEDYAQQLAHVVGRFLRHKSWDGVQRIVMGGGFQQTELGRRAIRRAAALLEQQGAGVALCRLHHHADEGGLVGWVHLAPTHCLEGHEGLLAVDIGGTNVRCGIVRTHAAKAADFSKADVMAREKWGHADDEDTTRREHMLQGIAEMLQRLARRAEREGLSLAPLVGVACPGLIRPDGSIRGGAQNLPGNWESPHFHLPTQLARMLGPVQGREVQVCVHNDAVVQGLSQRPFMQDVRHWAVLTVGTGLGNASFTNLR